MKGKLIENTKQFYFIAVTHKGGRIVIAVKNHFTDSPRHLDVRLVSLKHPNQDGHTTKLIQRHSASGRENRREMF